MVIKFDGLEVMILKRLSNQKNEEPKHQSGNILAEGSLGLLKIKVPATNSHGSKPLKSSAQL